MSNLETLTFQYLKSFQKLEDAKKTLNTLDIRKNKLLFIECESEFVNTARQLADMVGPDNFIDYVTNIEYLAKDSLEYLRIYEMKLNGNG